MAEVDQAIQTFISALAAVHSPQTSPELRTQATAYLEDAKRQPVNVVIGITSAILSRAIAQDTSGGLNDANTYNGLPSHLLQFAFHMLDYTVRSQWVSMSQEERETIKTQCLGMMMSCLVDASSLPRRVVSASLCGLVTEVAKREWPQQWPQLLPVLATQLATHIATGWTASSAAFAACQVISELRSVSKEPSAQLPERRRKQILVGLVQLRNNEFIKICEEAVQLGCMPQALRTSPTLTQQVDNDASVLDVLLYCLDQQKGLMNVQNTNPTYTSNGHRLPPEDINNAISSLIDATSSLVSLGDTAWAIKHALPVFRAYMYFPSTVDKALDCIFTLTQVCPFAHS